MFFSSTYYDVVLVQATSSELRHWAPHGPQRDDDSCWHGLHEAVHPNLRDGSGACCSREEPKWQGHVGQLPTFRVWIPRMYPSFDRRSTIVFVILRCSLAGSIWAVFNAPSAAAKDPASSDTLPQGLSVKLWRGARLSADDRKRPALLSGRPGHAFLLVQRPCVGCAVAVQWLLRSQL